MASPKKGTCVLEMWTGQRIQIVTDGVDFSALSLIFGNVVHWGFVIFVGNKSSPNFWQVFQRFVLQFSRSCWPEPLESSRLSYWCRSWAIWTQQIPLAKQIAQLSQINLFNWFRCMRENKPDQRSPFVSMKWKVWLGSSQVEHRMALFIDQANL